jgi:hypothetical protein
VLAAAKMLAAGMGHPYLDQKVMPINLILRQISPIRLKICKKSTNNQTNIITMVIEPLTPPALWIQ